MITQNYSKTFIHTLDNFNVFAVIIEMYIFAVQLTYRRTVPLSLNCVNKTINGYCLWCLDFPPGKESYRMCVNLTLREDKRKETKKSRKRYLFTTTIVEIT